MRVLVCGGRDFSGYQLLAKTLDELNATSPITLVIHGAAKGADSLGERWAREREIPYLGHPANWEKFGRSAGPIRNGEMLKKWRPQMVVAFPGGNGTDDMIKQSRKAGIEVLAVAEEA